jgi:hypothetical protein
MRIRQKIQVKKKNEDKLANCMEAAKDDKHHKSVQCSTLRATSVVKEKRCRCV